MPYGGEDPDLPVTPVPPAGPDVPQDPADPPVQDPRPGRRGPDIPQLPDVGDPIPAPGRPEDPVATFPSRRDDRLVARAFSAVSMPFAR